MSDYYLEAIVCAILVTIFITWVLYERAVLESVRKHLPAFNEFVKPYGVFMEEVGMGDMPNNFTILKFGDGTASHGVSPLVAKEHMLKILESKTPDVPITAFYNMCRVVDRYHNGELV